MGGVAILLILVLAAWLRGWGLEHGLPFLMGRPDEIETLRHTAGFPDGDLNPRWFVYPNLFFWLIWGWLELVLALRRLVTATPAYQQLLAAEPEVLIAYGRLLSACVGTATVAVIYGIGRRVADRATALVAAAVLATCFLHVRDSHALKADVLLAALVPPVLWTLASWVRAASLNDAAATWRAVLAGVAVGLATGIKYPAVLFLATGYHADRMAAGWASVLPSRRFWIFAAVATVVFLLCCPYLLLDQERFATTFSFSVKAVYGAGHPDLPRPPQDATWWELLGWYLETRTFDYHVAESLRWGCGLAATLLAPFALGLALRRRTHPLWPLLASFSLLYYAVVSSSQVTHSRYMTPLTPLLALAIGALLSAAMRRLPWPRARPALLAALLALIVAEPLSRAVAYDRVAAETDTRVLATRWMDTHLPADAVVAVLGSAFFPIADPDLPPGRRGAPVRPGDPDLDRHGVTHVVVHRHVLAFSRPSPEQLAAIESRLELLARFPAATSEAAGRFESLDAHYIPFHDFRGVERPGPLIEVYRWLPAASAGLDP